MASSQKAVSHFRLAGLSFIDYLSMSSTALRKVLKEPQRSEALSRSNFKYRERTGGKGAPHAPRRCAHARGRAGAGAGPRAACPPRLAARHARRARRPPLAALPRPPRRQQLPHPPPPPLPSPRLASPRLAVTGEFTYALGEDGKEFKESPAFEFYSDPSMAKKKVRPFRRTARFAFSGNRARRVAAAHAGR